MLEREARGDEARRHDAPTAEQLARERAERRLQDEGRRGQRGRAAKDAGEGLRELAIAHGHRCHGVDRTPQIRAREHPEDRGNEIVDVDPGKELPTLAEPPAETLPPEGSTPPAGAERDAAP